ncbi:cytochrome P450 2J2 isoform X3 [Bubalus bubalis]|uniref:cytochrome P450 2J2 isoform X3 n=1 Tax=Bubalus bubalis TaxID=89462 RepID=UPI001E1B7239|nr:cytochrome P450 2J2 isoform X3 [Bubalus bubalis]
MLEALGSLVAALWTTLRPGTVLLGAFVFLLFADFLKRQHPKNYPPGPLRLPFIGNVFHLDLGKGIFVPQQVVKKYGNIIRLDFGVIHSIVITGLPYIKEALVGQEQNFVNRPMIAIQKRIFNNKGQPFDPHFIINNAVSNIICSITFGERFDYQDDQFQELLKLLDEILCIQASVCCQLYNAFPRIMNFLPGSHHDLFRKWEKLKRFVANVIENHRKDWNPAEARDFIDAYLQEIEKHKDNATSSFDDENLICSTLDLFLAGTETTSTTLRWGLLFMALNPEIQEKVQAEIDRVLGQSQKVSTASRESMPYTNAVIHEVQRMGNIVPMNVPREVTVDTTLNGYHLVKGSMVLTNLTALHRDPAEWATPDTFNPEHFLENGQFKKRESFLPFSIGKRMCLGEQLARTELFIFFTSLLQKFTFRPPENEKLSLKFRASLTSSPASYRLCAIPRA